MIRTDQKNLVYANRFVHVFDDDVTFPSGAVGRYVRIGSAAPTGRGVVVLALRDGRVGLVRTYRYALGRYQWALPRGFSQGDELTTVRAELLEETGATSTTVRRLGVVTPDSGLLYDEVAVYLAHVPDVETCTQDTDEVSGLEWVDVSDLRDRILSGDIDDGFTLAAWCLYTLHDPAATGRLAA